MNYEKFTIKAQEALQEASSIASKNDHSEITTLHMLISLLQQQDGIVSPIVENIGVNVSQLTKKAQEELKAIPKVTGNNQLTLSSMLAKVLSKAENEMAALMPTPKPMAIEFTKFCIGNTRESAVIASSLIFATKKLSTML